MGTAAMSEPVYVQWCRPAVGWLLRPALALEPGTWWREVLLSAASLLARLVLVVYRAREKVAACLLWCRGARATRNDNEGV